MVDHLQNYIVKFNHLKPGTHQFEFQVDTAFFEEIESSAIDNGELTIRLDFTLNSSFFILDFKIDGFIKSQCDRCTEAFDLELIDDHKLIVKYNRDRDVKDDESDVLYITEGDIQLELAQIIYEYIVLSIPIMKLHPDDDEGNSTCNPEILEFLARDSEEDEEVEEKQDPRWEALKKLKK